MDPRRWEEIQATFDELVELDAAGRLSRLAALGTTDPALRQAVQDLLAVDAEADARLTAVEAAFRAPLASPGAPSRTSGCSSRSAPGAWGWSTPPRTPAWAGPSR